jgi:phage minor structural protein
MQVRIYWDKASDTSLVASKTTPKVLYISDLEFFKETKDKNNKLIIPLTCGGKTTFTGDVKKQYKMFSANQLKTAESIDDLVFEPAMETLDTSKYVPMMSASGEKTRTINVKESNYFNNLQTIAETFETWLELRVSRDDSGAITSKEVLFKNYTGKENLASFKYGINLKNIQRTFESKQLVTKLIVKMNNNELAPNGFCTI